MTRCKATEPESGVHCCLKDGHAGAHINGTTRDEHGCAKEGPGAVMWFTAQATSGKRR